MDEIVSPNPGVCSGKPYECSVIGSHFRIERSLTVLKTYSPSGKEFWVGK